MENPTDHLPRESGANGSPSAAVWQKGIGSLSAAVWQERINGQSVNPGAGWLVNPKEGASVNPGAGWLVNPKEGASVNPGAGWLVNLSEGWLVNPNEGASVNPSAGWLPKRIFHFRMENPTDHLSRESGANGSSSAAVWQKGIGSLSAAVWQERINGQTDHLSRESGANGSPSAAVWQKGIGSLSAAVWQERINGQSVNPNEGWLVNPKEGASVNPGAGWLVNPKEGASVNPGAGWLVNPKEGASVNPSAGWLPKRIFHFRMENPTDHLPRESGANGSPSAAVWQKGIGSLSAAVWQERINGQTDHLSRESGANGSPSAAVWQKGIGSLSAAVWQERINGQSVNPNEGWLVNPKEGASVNPGAGWLVNPKEGASVNPGAGWLVNPKEGASVNPSAGWLPKRIFHFRMENPTDHLPRESGANGSPSAAVWQKGIGSLSAAVWQERINGQTDHLSRESGANRSPSAAVWQKGIGSLSAAVWQERINGQSVNPNDGWLVNPKEGASVNPSAGWLVNRSAGASVNLSAGWLVSPKEGQSVNPSADWLVNPKEGASVNPTKGLSVLPTEEVSVLLDEMLKKVDKSIEYDQCIVVDLDKCRRGVMLLGGGKKAIGVRKAKGVVQTKDDMQTPKKVGRPRKSQSASQNAKRNVDPTLIIQQKVYSNSGGTSLKSLQAFNSVRSTSEKKSAATSRKQLERAKRKLTFGTEKKSKHVLAKHERKDPLVFGFVTRQVRRNVRGEFEVAVGQTQYLAENKGNPRMLLCGKRYRLVRKDYEDALSKRKEEWKSLKVKLEEAEKLLNGYGKRCKFSEEELVKLKSQYDRLFEKERKSKANLYRSSGVRASKRILWKIRPERNRFDGKPRLKMYLLWQLYRQRYERVTSQVEEAKHSLKLAKVVNDREQRYRKQHDADMKLKRRLRYRKWYVNHRQEKIEQVKIYNETMKSVLNRDRRLKYKNTMLLGRKLSCVDRRRRNAMARGIRRSLLEKYTENVRLKELSGQIGLLQSGTRVEREEKQREWRSAVVERIIRRTGEKMWRNCRTDTKIRKREELREKVESDIDHVLGVKNKLARHFTKKYQMVLDEITEWMEKVASSTGDCTYDSVMRSDEAKIHVRSHEDGILSVPRDLDYDEDGRAPCTEECALPANWAERLAKKLESLKPLDSGFVECVESVMQLELCNGCVVNHYCTYGIDGCDDAIRLMLAVRPHSVTIRSFLRKVYQVRRKVKNLVDVDNVLLEGTSSELTELLKRIGQKQSEDEGREQLVTLGLLPGPPTSAKILKEKWGDLVQRYHDIEKDHPNTVCFFCERKLRMKQIERRVKKLEDVKNAVSRENFANALMDKLNKDEWDSGIDVILADEECPFYVCRTCWVYVIKYQIGGPMLQNDMWVDDVPPELSVLNQFETFLVCRANPFYSVIQLKTYSAKRNASSYGLVKGIKGNAAHLRLGTAETASHVLQTMPATNVEDQMRIYALSIPTKEKTLWKNLVDMDKVLIALEWLKANNPLYKDVVIDKDAAEKIDVSKFVLMTCDDNAAVVDPNLEREDEEAPPLERMLTGTMIPELESEYVMQATDEAKVTAGGHVKAYQQVKVEGTPMNFKDTQELDMMSLPLLYPKGRGGVCVKREAARSTRHVRPREYYRYRLQHKSGRFRRMQKFLHVGTYLKRERGIGHGVYASTNTGSNLGQMKAHEIVTAMKHKDVEVERDLTAAFQAVKGTQEYWNRVKGDVQAMDETLGPATFFVTLSCAEFHWGELERYLREVNADLSGVSKMTLQELLVKDPVSLSEFFMRRFLAFMEEVILAKENGQATEGPLGLVEDYFWRLEYQSRGAPHIHMKLWIKDAPVVGVNVNEEVLRFIAKYIRADLPNEEENRELYNTVVAYQVHKCTGSCLRFVSQKKGRGFKRCRYGYPMPPCENYELNDFEESVKSHTNKRKRVTKLYNLPRGDNEVERCVNAYNPLVLSAWQANMDIQFLGEESRVLNAYITGYITKGEKNHTESIWESLNADKSVKSRIMSLVYERFRDREVGAYEMADDLLGNCLHGSSTSVVALGVGLPGKRSRKLKPYAMLKKLPKNSNDTKEDNVVETYYPTRHKDLRDICLYDIVRYYNFKRKEVERKGEKKEAEVVASDGDSEDEMAQGHGKKKKYWCTPDVGYFVKRKKPVIPKPRYVPCVVEKAEAFFQSLLQQFVPYVKEEEELKRGKATYKEAFDEWILQPGSQQLTDAKKRKDLVHKAVELRKRLEEEATAEEATDEQVNVEDDGYEDEVSPIDATGFRTVEDYMTDEGLEKRVRMLNSEQSRLYEEILGKVNKQVNGDSDAKQILMFVSGVAGTGKSKLIETLTEGVEKLSSHRVVLAAPTGMAAQNIQGRTAHAVFRLPAQKRDRWAYEKLDPARMKQMYAEIGQAKLIVIDEVSMVANRMLTFIHLRLQEMTGSSADVPFGGCNVVVLGDLLQLPPVGMKGMKAPYVFNQLGKREMKDAFPMSVFSSYPMNLWRTFGYGELTENMRQQNDRSYAEMLNEVRVGKLTEATASCLRSRVAKVEKTVDGHAEYLIKLRKEGKKPLCIMAKKKNVQAMNLAVMSKENIKPVLLHANDRSLGRRKKKLPIKSKFQECNQVDWPKVIAYVKENSSRDDNKTGGLADIVILGEGARVMLRRNLDVSRGLYNGAQGVVRKVVRNNTMPDGVSAVMVEFDGVPGGPVKVERATTTWHKGRTIEVKREQFPLCLCYAITIHKSQGLSLDCVVSDLGKDIFTYGMAYVVLSRVRTLEGLHLLEFDEGSIMCDQSAIKEYNRLRVKYTDLPLLEEIKGKEGKTVLKRSLNLAAFDVGDDVCDSQSVVNRDGGKNVSDEKEGKLPKVVRKKRQVISVNNDEMHVGDPPQLKETVIVKQADKVRRKTRDVIVNDLVVEVGESHEDNSEASVRDKNGTGNSTVQTLQKVRRKTRDVIVNDPAMEVGGTHEEESEVTMRVKVNSENSVVEKSKRRFSKALKDASEEDVQVVSSKRLCEEGSDVDGQFVPLRNPGVHCFGNASVQALLSCSSGLTAWVNGTMSSGIVETGTSLAMRRLLKPFFDAKQNGMGGKAYLEVVGLLKRLSENRLDVEVDFLDGEHHDSHEFLLKLFEQSESLGRLFLMRRKVKVICQSCFLETQYEDVMTTEWAMRLNETHGDKVDFEEFVQSNSIDEVEKRCESVQCGDMNQAHEKHTSMEMLDDSKYVIMKIERFIAECHNIILPNGKVGIVTTKREVRGAITGFNADDVSVLGEKLKVCAAVVYESATGEKGHYYTYVRSHGKDRWLKCDDKTCTGKAKFVPNLKKVMYMILERQ